MERSASDPIIQKTISFAAKGLGERFSTSEVSAPAMAEIAMPARISVSDPPRGPASASSSSTAARAPARADSGRASAKAAESPVWIERTAPRAADPDTPISPGSASGLRR